MAILQAVAGLIAGSTVKLLSGTTYTVDSSGFVAATSQSDIVSLGNMGFRQVDGRSNFTATADPAVGNDGTQNYSAGSLWLNTTASPPRAWINVSNGTGAAVWLQISLGALIATANSPSVTNLTLSGLLAHSQGTGITAFNGGGQASATILTKGVNNITTATASSAPYDSVKVQAITAGQQIAVFNSAANPVQLFGNGSDTINGFASGTGVTLPVGFIGVLIANTSSTWQLLGLTQGIPSFTTRDVYNTNTSTSGTTLTGANLTGGLLEVTLNMTGTLGGAANAQLPTVANLVAAIPNAIAGQSYKLRIINSSSGAFAWTVTTNTGWTLSGTMTIAQNTWRDFYVTLTTTAAAVLQQVGTGTNS
jgi:hypothetical protein